jgi:hypothetical protein
VANEHEVVQRIDAQESSCVSRVQHLIADCKPAEQPAQVALRGWAEVELRLLDEDDEAAYARVDERRDGSDEREPAVLGVAVVAHDPHRARRLVVGRCEQRRRAEARRKVERRRRSLAVEVQRAGRPRVEKERAAPALGLDMNARMAARDVTARRHRRGGLE